MSTLVRKKACRTCPFRLKHAERIFAGVLEAASKTYLRCHETDEDGLKAEGIQCRGFFDRDLGETTRLQKSIGAVFFVDGVWMRRRAAQLARRRPPAGRQRAVSGR